MEGKAAVSDRFKLAALDGLLDGRGGLLAPLVAVKVELDLVGRAVLHRVLERLRTHASGQEIMY